MHIRNVSKMRDVHGGLGSGPPWQHFSLHLVTEAATLEIARSRVPLPGPVPAALNNPLYLRATVYTPCYVESLIRSYSPTVMMLCRRTNSVALLPALCLLLCAICIALCPAGTCTTLNAPRVYLIPSSKRGLTLVVLATMVFASPLHPPECLLSS